MTLKLHPAVLHLLSLLCRSLRRSLAQLRYWQQCLWLDGSLGVPCLAGGNASAACLKMLVMRFADVQWPAPLSLLLLFVAQYKLNCWWLRWFDEWRDIIYHIKVTFLELATIDLHDTSQTGGAGGGKGGV